MQRLDSGPTARVQQRIASPGSLVRRFSRRSTVSSCRCRRRARRRGRPTNRKAPQQGDLGRRRNSLKRDIPNGSRPVKGPRGRRGLHSSCGIARRIPLTGVKTARGFNSRSTTGGGDSPLIHDPRIRHRSGVRARSLGDIIQ